MVACDRCHRKFATVAALKQHYGNQHSNVKWADTFENKLIEEKNLQAYKANLHPTQRSHSKLIIAIVLIVVILGGAAWYFVSNGSAQPNQQLSQPLTAANKAAELLSGSPPVLGTSAAPVTIVEFGDFQCPSFGQWFRSQEPLILQNLVQTGKAKLEWRDFDYYGPDSASASEAAYAAGEQGKFWQFYDILYSNQQTPNSGWASSDHLEQLAQGLGLNMTLFNASFQSHKYSSVINANYKLGTQLGVSGTPSFFVVGSNGRVVTIVGDQPYSVFESVVNSLANG
jgi:protein-disulfide isomerase